MLPALSVALTLSVSLAGEGDVSDAWHHFDRGRYDQAVQTCVALLEGDATNLEAHRAYVASMRRKDWNSPGRLEPVYSAWLGRNPEDPVARFAYAAVLHAKTQGSGCDEALPLLEPLPEDPGTRYAALRIARSWVQSCESERLPEIDAEIGEFGAEVPSAWSYGIWLQAKAGNWDAVVQALPEVIERSPERMRSIMGVAMQSDDKRAAAVVDAAAKWAAGWEDEPSPVALSAMVSVLTMKAGRSEKGLAAPRERLDELDPPAEGAARVQLSPLRDKIHEANKQPTHEAALEQLQKLAKKIPAEGEERELWNYFRSQRLEALDRPDEHYEVLADMARTQPDSGTAVNRWAYEASLRGEDLDEAIAAMERVLPSLDQNSLELTWGDYDDWMNGQQSTRAAWEDTYGWLLYQAGRHEEAANVLIKASQSVRDPTISAHAGLALVAMGAESQAWPYLVDANTQESGADEDALVRDARAALEKLWPERAEWHPDGLDGWLASRRAAEEAASEEEAASDPGDDHSLIGEAFPYESADKLGGGTLTFASEGILVVDLWATWCGPCVQGMPHLQQVAAEYADRGVRVVGLSVDENPGAVKKFYKGVDPDVIAYDLGHVGQSGFDTMRVTGIPALFVVRDGEIVSYIRGYGGSGDDRLERALEELL